MEYTCLKTPVDGLVGRLSYRKGSFNNTANVDPLPQKATFRQQDKTLVYLLDAENRVKSHVIRTAGETEGQMVVEEGLQAGDRILLSGMNKVMEGMKIQPISK